MSKEQDLDRLRARRDRLHEEIESMRNDADHWNRTHPNEEPIDVGALIDEPLEILASLDSRLGLT